VTVSALSDSFFTTAAGAIRDCHAVATDVIAADGHQLSRDLALVRTIRVHEPQVVDSASRGDEGDLVEGIGGGTPVMNVHVRPEAT